MKNIEPLLHGVQAFVAYESEQFICNGVFGAIPRHDLTQRLVTQLKSSWLAHKNGKVVEQTGPHHITRQVDAMKAEKKTTIKDGFQMFAPHVFFPFQFGEKDPGHPYNALSFAVHHYRPLVQVLRQEKQEG